VEIKIKTSQSIEQFTFAITQQDLIFDINIAKQSNNDDPTSVNVLPREEDAI